MDCDLLSRLHDLELRLCQDVRILAEAEFRCAASRSLGPLVAASEDGLEEYVEGLRHELHKCLGQVNAVLVEMNWDGPRMPAHSELQPDWWETVRRRARSVNNPSAELSDVLVACR